MFTQCRITLRRAAAAHLHAVASVETHTQDAVVDVSVVNVLAPWHKAAGAARDGAAAAKRDDEKKAAYAARGDSGYKFTPFSVESLGRLGAPALSFITRLGRKASAASAGTFSSRQFVEGVLQDIAVILARYNC